MYTATIGDFDTFHLTGRARKAADAIVGFLRDHRGGPPSGGGCRAFYSAEEWRERGERYCCDAVLVLVFDGGDLAPCLNRAYEDSDAVEAFQTFLDGLGYYAELGEHWYAGLYPTRGA